MFASGLICHGCMACHAHCVRARVNVGADANVNPNDPSPISPACLTHTDVQHLHDSDDIKGRTLGGLRHHSCSVIAVGFHDAQRFTQRRTSSYCPSFSPTFPAQVYNELGVILVGMACWRGLRSGSVTTVDSCSAGCTIVCRSSNTTTRRSDIQRRGATSESIT